MRQLKAVPKEVDMVPMPIEVADAIKNFAIDKKRGNITLNMKDGVILGCRVEEIVTVVQ